MFSNTNLPYGEIDVLDKLSSGKSYSAFGSEFHVNIHILKKEEEFHQSVHSYTL